MLASALHGLVGGPASSVGLEAIVEAHRGRALITRPDQLIYGEQDPLTEVYLLVSGLVRLFVGDDANRRTTGILSPPALFGDRDLLAGCPVSQESARSVERAHLLCFMTTDLDTAWADPHLREVWTTDLLRRSARASRFAAYLSQPLEDRLLWILKEHHPTGEGELPIYESLALMTDSAEKSVGRALRTLEESGRLELIGKRGWRFSPQTKESLDEAQLLGLFHHLTLLD
ncbi:MAG: Crp/Fnr family transcriptional regulator [Deltaproteobacteria bacterium]|nr:Crp/Fnr family transcriptional regulator [Deltaproteobacteria bacterium]